MKHVGWIVLLSCFCVGFVGCGGEESEIEVVEGETEEFTGDCAALVACHVGLQESAIAAGAPDKSDEAILAECETLVRDDYGNDEAACSAGLDDYSCP